MRAVITIRSARIAASAVPVALLLTLAGLGGPAGPAQAAPRAMVASTVAADRVEQEPTQAEIDAAHTKVLELSEQADAGQDDVASQRQALQNASIRAGLALEAYTTAVRRLSQAQLEEKRQQDLLTAAQASVAANRGDLGRWARQAYQDGGILTTHATLNALLQVQDSEDVGTTLTVLRRIGADRNNALDAVESARHQQLAATEAAADASQRAASAAVETTSARKAADEALAGQRVALGRAQTTLVGTQSALSRAKQRETALQAAQLLAAAAAGFSGSSGANKNNAVTGKVGSCTGGDNIQQYANGQIPLGALCPLTSSPGHYLRADAAYAFDRLSNAYAQRFGTAICVTDSYRSLAAQIDVYARKPNLAAHPGTSNHGWGTATDLCGGVQSFSSAQHHWMQVNAPLYGWFHPAWAQATGSKPEPWHWEFAG